VAVPAFFDKLRLNDATRTVWVFGAGASVFYDVPSQEKLLARFLDGSRPIKHGPKGQRQLEERRDRVEAYCRNAYPGLEPSDPGVALEELFALYELMRDDPRSTPEEVGLAGRALRDLLLAIRHATVVPGKATQAKWLPFARERERSPYAELIEQVFPSGTTDGGRHVFVTFNYDINLDRCVINLLESKSDLDIDYGVVFANSRCENAEVPDFRPPRPGAVLVLRPHGGLTWFRCLACRSVFTTLGRQQQIANDTVCWACGAQRVDYVLVHPSYSRRYDDPLLTAIWGRTYEELVKSDRWVFVGYSLPPADFHFRALLRQALVQRDSHSRETIVVLVSVRRPPSAGVQDQFAATVETYRAMFHERLQVWRATENGFVDFVSTGIAP
jgi:hypothetical protein